MKSPFAKTALMGLAAAIISIAAAWFYPWPEIVVESDLVGKPLFEAYDASSVRSISIIKYDPDRNGLDRIELRRSGEKWIIPARQNFVANNAAQLSLAVNSLNGNVLEKRSNDQQDHVEYGVVDPLEYESSTNRGSLGTKVVLEDRNNRELASLIVGLSPRGEEGGQKRKHFVRIPGQPNVYVLELSANALATGFTRWVSSNLLNLSEDLPFYSILVKNYRMTSEQLSTAERNWSYETLLDVKNSKRILRVPSSTNGELKPIEFADETIAPLRSLGNFIGNIIFTDVQKKSGPAASLLQKRQSEISTDLDSLKNFGFAAIDSIENKVFGLQFNAMGGEIVVRTADGVAISVLIGSIVEGSGTGSGDNLSLNHNVMLYATVDESIFPTPEPPKQSGDAEVSDKEQKAYLRLVEARNVMIKSAIQRATELNQSYADWYYVVSEQVINGLRPDLTIPSASLPNPNPPAVSPQIEQSKSDADEKTDSPDKK